MKKIILISMMFALLSCNSDDDNDTLCIPSPNWFEIAFINAQGDQLLGSEFVKDSFKLTGNNQVIYLKPVPFGVDETLQVSFEAIESGETYEIELAENVEDRLRFDFSTRDGSCGPEFIISEVFYNDAAYENPTPNSGRITFQRD